MSWLSILALIEDLFQVAAPIIHAHTSGQAQQISGVVDQVVTTLQTAVPLPAPTGVAATVESIAKSLAPIAGALLPAAK